jgi:hypothetical protein
MRRLASCVALASLIALCAAAGAAATTPERIRAAAERGEISKSASLLYTAYAVHAPERVPARFRAGRPYDATLALLQLRADVARLPRGSATRREIERVSAADAAGEACEDKTGASTDTADTPFHLQYGPISGGLTLDDYRAALVQAYRQVTDFGWEPPPTRAIAPPGGRYHVVIADLGSEVYGYTSTIGTYAGPVPMRRIRNTWDVADGEASCIVLNSNFAQLNPTAPAGAVLAALQATAAHEFNHALQFSLGVIESDDLNNQVLVEAGATLMEDEVADAANDNLHYLSRSSGPAGRPEPNFSDSLVPRPEGDTEFYAAWFLLRGLTERFGTTVPGGGEQVAQLLWELTSGRPPGGSYLGALDRALLERSGNTLNLGTAYHDAAIADWFLHDCGTGWPTPYCFEEAPAYRARFAPGGIPPNYTLAAVPAATPGEASVERNYAIEFVRLPNTGGSYDVTIANTAPLGASFSALRASVVCEKAAGLYRLPADPMTLAPVSGEESRTVTINTEECAANTVAAVVSSANHATQSPQCDSQVRYSVTLSPAGGPATPASAASALPAQYCNPVQGPDPSPDGTPTPSPSPSPSPTATEPPPATIVLPPADLTPPDIAVTLARRTLRGLLTFTVRCPATEETSCDVALRGSASRSRRKVSFKRALALGMAPGERRKVRVRLRPADLRKLGKGLVTVTLVTNANDAAGNRITGARFVLKTRI